MGAPVSPHWCDLDIGVLWEHLGVRVTHRNLTHWCSDDAPCAMSQFLGFFGFLISLGSGGSLGFSVSPSSLGSLLLLLP